MTKCSDWDNRIAVNETWRWLIEWLGPGGFTNSIGMRFVSIPPGEYNRGAKQGEEDALDSEQPQHRVRITRGFLAGAHEVTQGAYQRVMKTNPSDLSPNGDLADRVRGMETADFPVENVSWFDCIAFCNKLSELEGRQSYYDLTIGQHEEDSITSATVKIVGGDGYRLLTEAEWEYVARGGTDSIFPWGDSLSSTQANFDGDYPYGSGAKGPDLDRTTKVGSYEANPWGLYDTAGNVWEWVWDGRDGDMYKAFADKTAVDPTGPPHPTQRVLRGGSWNSVDEFCRPAFRDWCEPDERFWDNGFRVALGLSSE